MSELKFNLINIAGINRQAKDGKLGVTALGDNNNPVQDVIFKLTIKSIYAGGGNDEESDKILHTVSVRTEVANRHGRVRPNN